MSVSQSLLVSYLGLVKCKVIYFRHRTSLQHSKATARDVLPEDMRAEDTATRFHLTQQAKKVKQITALCRVSIYSCADAKLSLTALKHSVLGAVKNCFGDVFLRSTHWGDFDHMDTGYGSWLVGHLVQQSNGG